MSNHRRKPSKLQIDDGFREKLMNILSVQYGGPPIPSTRNEDLDNESTDIPAPPLDIPSAPPIGSKNLSVEGNDSKPSGGRNDNSKSSGGINDIHAPSNLNNSSIYHSAHHNLTFNNSNSNNVNNQILQSQYFFLSDPTNPLYKLLNFLVDHHIETLKRENEELRHCKRLLEEKLNAVSSSTQDNTQITLLGKKHFKHF